MLPGYAGNEHKDYLSNFIKPRQRASSEHRSNSLAKAHPGKGVCYG